MCCQGRNGFTLIELLVVVLILGALAAIVIPRFIGVEEDAEVAAATTNIGKVNDIIEGYIEAGVDVVNLQQPRALGIPDIGERYQGRISFESLADIQHTLPTGDETQVERDAEALMEYWADEQGGFVFSDYGDNRAIGVTNPDIKRFMYECFSRHSEELYGEPLPELTS